MINAIERRIDLAKLPFLVSKRVILTPFSHRATNYLHAKQPRVRRFLAWSYWADFQQSVDNYAKSILPVFGH